jgi:hypothetical protein
MKHLYATLLILTLVGPTMKLFAADVKTAPRPTSSETACHGTAIEFVNTPVEAAKLAGQQKKLVLVLHVSGYFEDPNFT